MCTRRKDDEKTQKSNHGQRRVRRELNESILLGKILEGEVTASGGHGRAEEDA